MPVLGAIATRTQGILPVTWDALSKDVRYGDSFLQTIIDLAKENVFGTVVSPVAEDDYPRMAIDYAAKIAAIELCTTGIDFWMDHSITATVTQPNEITTYTDRSERIKELRKQLVEETRRIADEIAQIIGFRRPNSRVPLSNTLNDEFLTPSPQEFPRPYRRTAYS